MSFKRVAILCSGPSLPAFADVDVCYHDTIGVGASVARFNCRWWCFSEAQMYQQVTPIGRPLLFVSQAVSEHLRQVCPRVQREVVVPQESIEFPLPRAPGVAGSGGALRWTRYAGLAALALAWHLEADVVDIYGCDLMGRRDFRGQLDHDRHIDRWHRQLLLMEQMVNVFIGRGRKVQLLGLPRQRPAVRQGEGS